MIAPQKLKNMAYQDTQCLWHEQTPSYHASAMGNWLCASKQILQLCYDFNMTKFSRTLLLDI